MTYSTKIISHSLQQLAPKLEDYAKLIFKYILQYLLERKTKFALPLQINKLLVILRFKSIEIVDEFYLQIVKQMNNPPSSKILKRLLALLGIIASFVPLTIRLFFPFLNFLYQKYQALIKEKMDEETLYSFRFVFFRLKNLFEKSQRVELPLENEIFLIEHRKKLVLPIYFLQGGHSLLFIESYNTVLETKKNLFKKLFLNQEIENFGLYEVIIIEGQEITKERFLSDETKIMDVLINWERTRKQYNQVDIKLYLRIRVFFKFNVYDYDTLEMLFRHFLFELLRGRLPVEETLALKLGALSLAVEHGDFSNEKARFLKVSVEKLIPKNLLKLNNPQVWIDKILMYYLKIKSYDSVYAKLAFLDFLKEHDLFFAEQFEALHSVIGEGKNKKISEQNIFFVVKPKEILICQGDIRKIIKR